MRLSDFGKAGGIEAFVRSLPNVSYAERTVITSDIEFDLEVRGFPEFTKTMALIKERFPNWIRDYSYYSRISLEKVSYFPRA